MNKTEKKINSDKNQLIRRRDILGLGASTTAAMLLSPLLSASKAMADTPHQHNPNRKSAIKAFVYTELQISVPFEQAPWKKLNPAISAQPGFINKTWFAGVGNNSIGGIYAFDSIKNAQKFVTGYFPNEARKFGVAHTTRVFDAAVAEQASRDINSAHFGAKLRQKPGAFVYTEVQVNVPFNKAPWHKRNPVLKKQPGLLGKTWLSGVNTNTLGGIDAFDTIENAQAFAINDFPLTAARLNAAFYTRVFDAHVVEEASRQMNSPFFT